MTQVEYLPRNTLLHRQLNPVVVVAEEVAVAEVVVVVEVAEHRLHICSS